MSKKFSIIIALFLGLGMFFGSCSDDDDKNQVSEEWIAYQKKMVTDVMELTDAKTGKEIYTHIPSDLAAGLYVYSRPSDYITNNLKGKFNKKGPDAFYEFDTLTVAPEKREVIEQIKYDTDIAVVRYHGWYFHENGKKTIFESTETDSYGNSQNNGVKPREFIVGELPTEGFKTALYDMKVGEDRIICIPHNLGYGTYGDSRIPGYTTLFFDIKLMEIKRK